MREEAVGRKNIVSGIRVVLVGDHALVRDATRALLLSDQSIEVVGEAETPEQALQLIADLNPDVAMVDVRLKEFSGIDLANVSEALTQRSRS